MKSYFALDGGVVVSKDIYTQERFGTAEKIKKTKSKVKSRFVFHPTYTTTGHMFRCVFDRLGWRRMLLFGKWGIGKSLAIVLATMLSNHISEFHYNNADTP